MDSIVNRGDYVLIAIGLLLLAAWGLGLIILAVAAWRIGQRWETSDLQKAEYQQKSTLDLEAEEEEAISKEQESESTLSQSTELNSWQQEHQTQSRFHHLGFQKTYKLNEYDEIVLEDGK